MCKQLIYGTGQGIITRKLYVCLGHTFDVVLNIIDLISWICGYESRMQTAGPIFFIFCRCFVYPLNKDPKSTGDRQRKGCSLSFHWKMLSTQGFAALGTHWDNTARIYWSYFQILSLSLSLLQRHKTDEETFQKISCFRPCCQEPRLRHLGLGVAMVTTTSNSSWHKAVIQQLIKYRSQGLGKWLKFEALSLSV